MLDVRDIEGVILKNPALEKYALQFSCMVQSDKASLQEPFLYVTK